MYYELRSDIPFADVDDFSLTAHACKASVCMRTWALLLVRMASWCVVMVLLLGSVGAWADSDVIELDSATFDEGIADLEIVLVEFYAPW